MINFTRSGKQVKAAVKYKSGDLDTHIYFYWECGSEVTAEALANQLQNFQENTVEREIKAAYEVGYRAGRGKKAKRPWFHTYLTHINEQLQDWKKQ
jgi:ribosomal protein L18